MNASIIEQSLYDLSLKRPLFWSEADFQFAFSEALRVHLPYAKIRLERPIPISEKKNYHVDIVVEDDEKIYPIELKYKTKKCSVTIANEKIHLTNQSAEDLGRYDYVADIKRIEEIRDKYKDQFGEGYAIMLTNNLGYTIPSNTPGTMDAQFRIDGNTLLSGTLKWTVSPQYKKVNDQGDRGIRKHFTLSGVYQPKWKTYNVIINKIRNKSKLEAIKSCIIVIK